MLSLQGVIVESAVDWITCTAKTTTQQDRIRHKGQALLLSEIQTGQECRPWRHKGYEGFTTGHCEVGTRFDSTIVRLHGHLAATDWFDVFQESENTSRLDVQVTLQHESDDGCLWVHKIHEVAKEHKLYGKPQSWHLRTDSANGDTLYLGRHASDVFLRIYCKAHESRLNYYDRCLRIEAQLNRHLARQYATALADGRLVQDGCLCFLSNFAQARGIVLGDAVNSLVRIGTPKTAGTRQDWLGWLAKSVKPHLKREIEQFGTREVFKALGLTDYIEPKSSVSDNLVEWEN